jgi:DNA-binding CsgD family transcriptional regulator
MGEISMTPQYVGTAGFTPLERSGLALLLREHGFDAVEVDAASDFTGVAVPLQAMLIDLTDSGPSLDDGVRSAADAHPQARVVGLSHEAAAHAADAARNLPIHVVLDTASSSTALIDAIVGQASRGRPWRRPLVQPLPLTTRERQVLGLIAAGHTSKTIATQLDISPHTVESHKQRVFRRLGVQNQAQAVAVALRLGLLSPPDRASGVA